MIGELEYKETFVSDRTKNRDIPINLIFFVFVIGVPIIINNLLIGLTVDNVTELTENAALKGLKSQIKTLETIQSSLMYSKVGTRPLRKHILICFE